VLGSSLGDATEIDLADADYIFTGEFDGDLTGISVATAGDVDGDERADLLIGGKGHYGVSGHTSTYPAGRAYLVLGSSQGESVHMSLADSDYAFVSETTGHLVGSPVRSAGDVDADGLDDIMVVSAHNEDGYWLAGHVYVFLGRLLGDERTLYTSSSYYSIAGDSMYERTGFSVTAGDIDGDGSSDIVIGSYGRTGLASDSGVVSVFMGDRLGYTRLWPLDDAH
jgi:hypothetical protein